MAQANAAALDITQIHNQIGALQNVLGGGAAGGLGGKGSGLDEALGPWGLFAPLGLAAKGAYRSAKWLKDKFQIGAARRGVLSQAALSKKGTYAAYDGKKSFAEIFGGKKGVTVNPTTEKAINVLGKDGVMRKKMLEMESVTLKDGRTISRNTLVDGETRRVLGHAAGKATTVHSSKITPSVVQDVEKGVAAKAVAAETVKAVPAGRVAAVKGSNVVSRASAVAKVGKLAKFGGVLGAVGAVYGAIDAKERWENQDRTGAALQGISSAAAGVASVAVFIPGIGWGVAGAAGTVAAVTQGALIAYDNKDAIVQAAKNVWNDPRGSAKWVKDQAAAGYEAARDVAAPVAQVAKEVAGEAYKAVSSRAWNYLGRAGELVHQGVDALAKRGGNVVSEVSQKGRNFLSEASQAVADKAGLSRSQVQGA